MGPAGIIAAIITAIVGYAAGTAQVLALDWVRERREHAHQLRLVRSELRRARSHKGKYAWTDEGPPSDSVPQVPRVTDVFTSSVAALRTHLTEEFEGDSFQEGLFGLLDGLDMLRRYHDGVEESLRNAKGGERTADMARHRLWAMEYASEYDKTLDEVMYQIDSALDDIARRLREVRLWRQAVARPLGALPPGEAPPPLTPNDPRLEVWRERQIEEGHE